MKNLSDGTIPQENAFTLPDECENWCSKSYNCNAVSYNYDTNGNVNCKYYSDQPNKIINSDNLIKKIGK